MIRVAKWSATAFGAGLILVAWEVIVRRFEVPEYLLPPPSTIWQRLWQTLPVQLEEIAFTAATTLIGLFGALVVGVLLALMVTYVRPLRSVVLPAFAAFQRHSEDSDCPASGDVVRARGGAEDTAGVSSRVVSYLRERCDGLERN